MRILSEFRLLGLGPIAAIPFWEAIRSGCGALLALAAVGLIALSSYADTIGFALIAPFGASAVLLFAAVNSPLAQPWPVVVGNTISAIMAITVCAFISEPLIAMPFSVGGAILAMALLRATHPPGGAVALTVALAASQETALGFAFALIPVALGSILLVLLAILWARLTGRSYPMRQFGAPGPVLTSDPSPLERSGLSETDLKDLLADYRQSLNLGVKDLARLIGAAELRAASHQAGPKTAGEIMSRNLVTVGPDAPLGAVADIFCRHGFTSLPVVSANDMLRGVIFQLDLIAALSEKRSQKRTLWFTGKEKTAAQIMSAVSVAITEDTPVRVLVSQLSERGTDAVMVIRNDALVGVVTQTDLIGALAREIVPKVGSDGQ